MGAFTLDGVYNGLGKKRWCVCAWYGHFYRIRKEEGTFPCCSISQHNLSATFCVHGLFVFKVGKKERRKEACMASSILCTYGEISLFLVPPPSLPPSLPPSIPPTHPTSFVFRTKKKTLMSTIRGRSNAPFSENALRICSFF